MVKYWTKNISRNIEAMFFKLGTGNIHVHHGKNKMMSVVLLPWQQFCSWSSLSRIEITSFYLNQVSSTPSNLMKRVMTILEPCLFWAGPSIPLANADICFMIKRHWSLESFHGNDITGVILFLLWCSFLVPGLKITAPIFLIQYFTFLVAQFTVPSLS